MDDNDQSPASAALMLRALAAVLDQLPAPTAARDRRARAFTTRAVRDAARAVVDQHDAWTGAQLAAAHACDGGEWERELLQALVGVDRAHHLIRRQAGNDDEGEAHARLGAARCR